MQYNALQSLQAFEMGQGQRKQREYDDGRKKLGNALAGGDYAGGASMAYGMGDIETGMALQGQQKTMLDAEQEAKRTGLMRYGMSLLQTPAEQREAMRPQIAQTLASIGVELPQDQLSTMDLSDAAIQATLQSLQDPESLMKQYQAQMNPDFRVVGDSLLKIQGSEVTPAYTAPPKPVTPGSSIGKLRADLEAGRITQGDFDAEVTRMQRSGVNVNVNTGANGPEIGTIPQGYAVVRDPSNPSGYRLEPIPGGEAALERDAAAAKDAKNLGGTAMTVGNLIGAYSTLAKNNAISAQGNSAGENIAALYSKTPLGKLQDEIGGDVGNLENAEARQTIEGLSMNALMKMISMSDVSAKAMDSDAEMKAWLSAIKSDNYEAALTKLHVLDVSFGRGTALQEAFANGVVDQATYQRVTRRLNSDPMTKQMYDRAQRIASLEQAIGADNMTAAEMAELERLEALERGGQ